MSYEGEFPIDKPKDCGRCGRRAETFRNYDEYLEHVLNC